MDWGGLGMRGSGSVESGLRHAAAVTTLPRKSQISWMWAALQGCHRGGRGVLE